MDFKVSYTVKFKTKMSNPLDPYNNVIIIRRNISKLFNYDKLMISLVSKSHNSFVGTSTEKKKLETSKILLTEKSIKSLNFFNNV